jgi:putative photosynthetic complex assembly protein 2
MAWLLISALWVVALWWSSTVLVLHLNGMAPRTFPLTVTLATVAAVFAFSVLVVTLDETSPSAVLAGFGSALVIWGWNELTFLTGTITGRRKRPCAAHCHGLLRFRHATEAVLHHELALLACFVAIGLLSLDMPNQIGLMTFAALWMMRLSSKLNLFLGVPNSGAELLPERVSYLQAFFGHRTMNWLFPISISCLTITLCLLIFRAHESTAALDADFSLTKYSVLAALVALGTLEHWLLVLPVRVASLWQHGLRSRRAADPSVGPASLRP